MPHPNINVVWLKRDLRLQDHEPLANAINSDLPAVLLYVFEPELIEDAHYSERHWRFTTQSLQDINRSLRLKQHPEKGSTKNINKALDKSSKSFARVSVAHCSVLQALKELSNNYKIIELFSHEETGLDITFKRDKAVALYCNAHNISWIESPKDAVQRGAKSRQGWNKSWTKKISSNQVNVEINKLDIRHHAFDTSNLPNTWKKTNTMMQRGGSTQANQVLQGFLKKRGKQYQFNISKPSKAELSCSRMSPYLAWGNISLRQLYQATLAHRKKAGWKRALTAFSSRLHWHCHFIQKFESEAGMEFNHINAGYEKFPYKNTEQSSAQLIAWKTGNTGYPLVDACMRCLIETGYVNFRMRAMLVSFLTHHLQIDWRMGVKHLASVFLDFEPGIHYAQCQMQAGVTGINTIRIYNPTKQAKENDADGAFILQWCPELSALPKELIYEPWLLTPMDELLYDFTLGKAYPLPIVDLSDSFKYSRDLLWKWRKRPDVKRESSRILSIHVHTK